MKIFYLMLAIIASLRLSVPAHANENVGECGAQPGTSLYLNLETSHGPIVVELFERAAPRVISQLIKLVRGPIFNPSLIKKGNAGYYDGLVFNYTKPHIEIVTGERQPGGMVEFNNQIDASSLGLDKDIIQDKNQAMNVLQFELLKKFVKTKKLGGRTEQLDAWLIRWNATQSADFLMGVSRMEINQALGYTYFKGLDSREVKRGSVALKPKTPGKATARLSIALTDFPRRTGLWMVIGQVVDGLDVAERISLAPLIQPRHIKTREYIPLNPVVIKSAVLACQ